ncbi:MAG: tetratricopeptide repeat protein [Fidelibacterota bacterium]
MMLTAGMAQPDTSYVQLLSQAQARMEAGNYKLATISLQLFLKRDSTSYDALIAMAKIKGYEQDYSAAVDYYNRILKYYTNDPDAILGRARVYAWEGRYEEAEKEFVRVTQRFPDYQDAWAALGDLYLWWNKPEEAEEIFTYLIELDPDNAEYYLKRGKIYAAKSNVNEAREDLTRAIDMGGNPRETYSLLQEINRAPGQALLNGGILYTNEVFSRDDNLSWSAYHEMGKIASRMGTFILHGMQYSRGADQDGAFGLDSYVNTWNKSYLNVFFQLAQAPNFIPYSVVRLEIFQGVGKKWEVSYSTARMNFSNNPVNIYHWTLARYNGNWYLRSKFLWVPSGSTTSRLYQFSARRFLKAANEFFEISYGWSAVPSQILSLTDLSRAEAFLYEIRWQHKLLGDHLVFLNWAYRDEATTYTQTITFGYWLNLN